jgi:dipeptidyl aminopeptidase/acylaminoacyl peptidase
MTRHISIALIVAACGGSPAPAPAVVAEPAPPPVAASMQPAPPPPPAAVGHPKQDLIPRKVLFGNPERTAVRISPDGKQLSWLAAKDGVLNIWVAPINKLDQAKPVTAETTRPIEIYRWAYTNKHLLYEHDTGGDENFHVFRVDLADGKTTDLTPLPKARANIVALSDALPTQVAITINDRDPKLFDLVTLDLLTGKRVGEVQNTDEFGDFTVDHLLRVRVATKKLPDGSAEIYTTTAANNPAKRTWDKFDTIGPTDADSSQVIAVSPDDRTLYMTDSRASDTGGVVAVDIKTKKQTVLGSDPKAEASDTVIDPHTGKLQAISFEYDRVRWQVLDKAIAPDIAAMAKLAPGGDAAIVARTQDDKQWIVASFTEQKPGEYWLWNRATHKGTLLFDSRPELASYKLAPMASVVIPARDGLQLVSYLTLPVDSHGEGPVDGQTTPKQPLPMVLLVHGGPWARDSWGPNPIHQLLANRGYAVLSVNYRGSTNFGKKFLNAGNLQWGKAMHTDLLDAVAWATKAGIAAPNQVCIMGGSYGGYATLAGLTMTPDVFACGVDIVGPSNLLTLLATIPPYWAPLISMFHTRMGDPTTPEGKAILVEASPLTHAAAIKRPLLIGQGANDPRVNQAESEQIVAAMQKHGLPVSYALFPDEGHGFHRPENNIAFFGVAEAFLSAHLGGYYLPLTKEEVTASSMQIKSGADGIPGLPH